MIHSKTFKSVMVVALVAIGFHLSADMDLDEVRSLRLAGDLGAALALAEAIIADQETSLSDEFELHLELARIHDRFGLHFRRRPVVAALAEIDKATDLAQELGDKQRAAAILMRATYYYRAEMSERKFPIAIELVDGALMLFSEIGDLHGQAEAVHLRGLIHLQMRELDLARKKFDESLLLDESGGKRVFFSGEYERHVAFVYIFQDQRDLAVPHLERSLVARKEAGAVDASLFAANTLANQLLVLKKLDDIEPVLNYAESVLQRLDSPYAAYQFHITNGRYFLEIGKSEQASVSFRKAREAAESIDWDAGVSQAEEFLSGT